MIKVLVAFPVLGFSTYRWVESMKKYLPDDVEITQIMNRWTEFNGVESDIVMTHSGASAHYPLLAVVSPKIVFTEATDKYSMSYITDKDLVISYKTGEVTALQEQGYNIIPQPRPVDLDIFYREHSDKSIDVMSVNIHEEDLVSITGNVINRLGNKHLIMQAPGSIILDDNALVDYCWIPKDNDRMRDNYCKSKYAMSLLREYDVYGTKSVGWEVGNVEALLCGTRPICLRSKGTTYREDWLGKYMEYVSEESFSDDLMKILSDDYWTLEYREVTQEEINEVAAMVDAKKLWAEIWDNVRGIL